MCAWQQSDDVTVSCCCQRLCYAGVGAWGLLLLLLLAHPGGCRVCRLHLQCTQHIQQTAALLGETITTVFEVKSVKS